MLDRVTGILLKNRILFLLSLIVILSGFAAGVLSYDSIRVRRQAPAVVEEAYSGIFSESLLMTVLNVIFRNMWASAIVVVTGLTIFLSVGIVFINGFVIGLVMRLSQTRGLRAVNIALGILPHGIFEVPALLISSAVGLRLGLSLIRPGPGGRRKSFVESLREAVFMYVVVVLPLLVIASVVEILVSRRLIFI
jgi:stage II sporulation protein M